MADLRDEDELEWDSEEYHDVEAIIIAEVRTLPRPRPAAIARSTLEIGLEPP